MIAIAVDGCSPEHGSEVSFKACLQALSVYKDLTLYWVGPKSFFDDAMIRSAPKGDLDKRFININTAERIEQTDNPIKVLRQKRGSSTHVAVGMCAEGSADAVVSCCNTGALMAVCRYKLKRVKGISKLALSSRFPCEDSTRDIFVADSGASMDMNAEEIHAIAHMLNALGSRIDVDGKKCKPSIGLLSCGAERGKGNALVRQAFSLLEKDKSLNFYGLVEPGDIFKGTCDVVVCEGFVGNVLVKACESTSNYVMGIVKSSLRSSWLGRLSGMILSGLLKPKMMHIKPEYRGSGFVLGVNGVVVKAHGASCDIGFLHAIKYAYQSVESGALEKLNAYGMMHEQKDVRESDVVLLD